jgi:hypothetical protein
MKFEVAIQKSIRSFMNGKLPKESETLAEQFFYTPDYFDQLEDTLLEEAPKDKKKKKEELADEDV